MSELDDVVREFLVESHENLDALARDALTPEEATWLRAFKNAVHG